MAPQETKTIVVIGLGEIGRPLFDLIQKTYPSARGVDVTPVTLTEPVGIMHVCFPHDLAKGFVATAAEYAKKYRPEIVVVNSTVRPGTTRDIEKAVGVPTVYSPIRGKHVRMHDDLMRYQKFVAGTDAAAVARVRLQFEQIGMKAATMKTPEALELAKLSETTYFGVLLAWAQELERYCQEVGADYFDVVRIFEEVDYLPRVSFRPGFIGGHCIMPNIGILRSRFDSPLLDAIVKSNETKAAALAAHGGSLTERVSPLKIGERPA